eukprot:1417947-Rhodomonas_salina.1
MGGGLHGSDGCSIVSNDTEWWYNGHGSQGGGIAIYVMTTLMLNDNLLKMNNATHGGGLFAHTDCDVSAVDSTWESNTAVIDGGGIAGYESSTITLRNIGFMFNEAQYGAGVLARTMCNVTAMDSMWVSNDAADEGGGVALYANSMLMLTE